MVRGILVCAFITLSFHMADACRFTVREIGFSTLSRDIYSLVIIDKNADANDPKWAGFREQLNDSNIKLSVLHPVNDSTHPYVKMAQAKAQILPAQILFAPDGKVLRLSSNGVSDLLKKVLDSGMRHRLRNDFIDVFSVILWIEGKNKSMNLEIGEIIQESCDRIRDLIPLMPKEVKNGPVSIRFTAEDMHNEKVLLWSLGIEEQPNEPVAFVLYGRGRIMGDAVNASAIVEGTLYKYMSMIGADCECGLDRKWMLGDQIPLLWPSKISQQLANDVGFDVDNPMILAEMSRILAKETNPDIAGDVGYGIEVIDLNAAFDEVPEISYENEVSEEKVSPVVLVLFFLVMIIVISGVIVFYRNRKK